MLKLSFTTASILHHFNPLFPSTIITDTSDFALIFNLITMVSCILSLSIPTNSPLWKSTMKFMTWYYLVIWDMQECLTLYNKIILGLECEDFFDLMFPPVNTVNISNIQLINLMAYSNLSTFQTIPGA